MYKPKSNEPKSNQSNFSNEKAFVSDIFLDDKTIKENYSIHLDGKTLTENEVDGLITYIRKIRSAEKTTE